MRAPCVLLASLLCCTAAGAQESRLASDFRRQGERVAEACDEVSFKVVASCGYELFTGFPLHVAVGSLAPGNGFAFGVAFVEHYTPNESWRIGWNADAVRSLSGSWRVGGYMKLIHTAVEAPVPVARRGGRSPRGAGEVHEYPVVNLYAQATSLRTLLFFGPQPDDANAARSAFSERQVVVGAGLVYPVARIAALRALRPAILGAVNGRFLKVRGRASGAIPALDAVYTEREAPGLTSQPGFLQLAEGVRLRPEFMGGRLRTNYVVQFQQFLANGSPHSFRRVKVDLRHEFPLYRDAAMPGASKDTNGPDECFVSVGSTACPPLAISRNRYGAVGIRLLVVASGTSGANRVPFYFQPTLGGSDIDGERLLSSADDYRYRGPHVIALQETFEHSLWGPVGVAFQADQGKVTARRGDLDFGGLRHSYAIGLTIRAGGLPFVTLSFAWGTGGRHAIMAMDSSLLGGSTRPSLQ